MMPLGISKYYNITNLYVSRENYKFAKFIAKRNNYAMHPG